MYALPSTGWTARTFVFGARNETRNLCLEFSPEVCREFGLRPAAAVPQLLPGKGADLRGRVCFHGSRRADAARGEWSVSCAVASCYGFIMDSLPPASASAYRGRLAPSPSGYLHVGHARTFWAAWQRAREAGGALAMRIEDLDPERSKAAFAEAALEDLRRSGIEWQEGPDVGGPFAPYEQSKRQDVYQAAWRRLAEAGCIYPCNCSRKDLEAALAAPHESSPCCAPGAQPNPEAAQGDDEPVYPGRCRPGTEAPADVMDAPGPNNWRFRVPDGKVVEFDDGNLGRQRFQAGVDFGDFLVWRRDGTASYQLAWPTTRPWGLQRWCAGRIC